MDLGVFGDLNWLAVIVGTIAYFAWGGLWYGMLSKPWIAASGIDPATARGSTAVYGVTVALYLVTTAVLAFLARHLLLESVGDGITLGLVTGIGFLSMAIGTMVVYGNAPQKAKLWLINSGNAVIGSTIAAVIVTIWD